MCAARQGSNSMPYKNSSLPVEKRVADLLKRMTLEEKAAQMTCIWEQKKITFIDENGNFDEKMAKASFKHGNGIGQIGRRAMRCLLVKKQDVALVHRQDHWLYIGQMCINDHSAEARA